MINTRSPPLFSYPDCELLEGRVILPGVGGGGTERAKWLGGQGRKAGAQGQCRVGERQKPKGSRVSGLGGHCVPGRGA